MTSQRARDRLGLRLQEMGISNPLVLEAIRTVPRHIFVDEALASRAYENSALPIGHGQTISQPYIVARMTEVLLDSGTMDQVLEIGSGCGYQSAILARFAKRVFSIERIAALAWQMRHRIDRLKLYNIQMRHSDGKIGWRANAPFDAILVAAASAGVPEALKEQLKVGGRLVIPVGDSRKQRLLLITRGYDGFNEECLDAVTFVPMLEGVG